MCVSACARESKRERERGIERQTRKLSFLISSKQENVRFFLLKGQSQPVIRISS